MRITLNSGTKVIYRFPKTGSENARIVVNSVRPDITNDLHLVIDIYYNDGDAILIVSDSNLTDLSNVATRVKLVEISAEPSNLFIAIEVANDVDVKLHKIYGKGNLGDFSGTTTDVNCKIIYNTIPTHSSTDLYLHYIYNTSTSTSKYILDTGNDLQLKTIDSFIFDHDTATKPNLIIKDSFYLGPSLVYWTTIDNSPWHPVKINIVQNNEGILFVGDTGSLYSPVLAAWDVSTSSYLGALKFYYSDTHLLVNSKFLIYTGISTLNDDTTANRTLEVSATGMWTTNIQVEDKITTENLKVNTSTSLAGLYVSSNAYFNATTTINAFTHVQNSLGVDNNLSVGGSLNVSGTKNAAVPKKDNPKDLDSRIFCAALESPFQSGVYYILRNITVNGKTKVKIPKIFLNTINPDTMVAFIQVRGKNPTSISYTIKEDDLILYPESFYSIRVNVMLWGRRWDNQNKEDLAFKTYKKFHLKEGK